MKEQYEKTELEIFEFTSEDILATSGEPFEENDEMPIRKGIFTIR